jgi:hypothetical protein
VHAKPTGRLVERLLIVRLPGLVTRGMVDTVAWCEAARASDGANQRSRPWNKTAGRGRASRLFVTFTAPSFGKVHTRKAQGRLVLPCHP